MAQPRRETSAPVRRVRANNWEPMGGPQLPSETWALRNDSEGLTPLAPVPASSEGSDPPPLTEAEAIRLLVKHYRWCHLGDNKLMRWNPHGRAIAAEVEALGDE